MLSSSYRAESRLWHIHQIVCIPLVAHPYTISNMPVQLLGGDPTSIGDAAVFGVITVSDRASSGVYEDLSGPGSLQFFGEAVASPWTAKYAVIPDERPVIEDTIKHMVSMDVLCLDRGRLALTGRCLSLHTRHCQQQFCQQHVHNHMLWGSLCMCAGSKTTYHKHAPVRKGIVVPWRQDSTSPQGFLLLESI